MSRYDTQIEGFTTLRVSHDTNLNSLEVKAPYLNSTIRNHWQAKKILQENDFEYNTYAKAWIGRYSDYTVRQIRRIEQLLTSTETKNRIKHG